MQIKLVMAASTLLSTCLIGMILSVSANVGALINSAHASSMSLDRQIIAREASEGPRGFDNERPGDKHRGRRGKSIEHFEQIS
jgi:hypothetical protein